MCELSCQTNSITKGCLGQESRALHPARRQVWEGQGGCQDQGRGLALAWESGCRLEMEVGLALEFLMALVMESAEESLVVARALPLGA